MKKFRIFVIFSLGLLLAGGSPLLAGSGMGLVVFKKGSAHIYKKGVKSKLRRNALVRPGDVIQTGRKARVSVQFSAGVIIQVGPSSKISVTSIGKIKNRSDVDLHLSKGTVAGRKKSKGSLIIRTPAAIASVRGTDFIVETDESSEANTKVMVDNGQVDLKDPKDEKTAELKGGTKGVVSKTKAIQSGILEAFERQKFQIFKEFNRQKKANLEMIIEQKRKNEELMKRQKSLFPE